MKNPLVIAQADSCFVSPSSSRISISMTPSDCRCTYAIAAARHNQTSTTYRTREGAAVTALGSVVNAQPQIRHYVAASLAICCIIFLATSTTTTVYTTHAARSGYINFGKAARISSARYACAQQRGAIPSNVPSMSFHNGIVVAPAAYDTKSEDVSGFTRSRNTTQTPLRTSRCSYLWTDLPSIARSIYGRPKIRMIWQATPAPMTLPVNDRSPPQNPPKMTPPGAYSIAPGNGARTTSPVTIAIYANETATPSLPKNSYSCWIFSAAEN